MEQFWFQILASTFSPEAVAKRCSVEKVVLKNLQNSWEKHCAGVSFFNKVAGLRQIY